MNSGKRPSGEIVERSFLKKQRINVYKKNKLQVVWHHFTTTTSRRMKAIFLAMSGLLALAKAAPHPQYGYDNNFSGHEKPLTGSYSSCKVEWRTVKKAGYKEVIEEKPKTVCENVCKYVYQTTCKNIKVYTYLLILLVFEGS
jgi:hypothetical protein